MKRACLAVLVAVVWLAACAPAFADDGPMFVTGTGGSVRPMKRTDIRMAAETVQAICYSRFAEYRVDFRFENSAATQTVLLGFPFNGPWSGGDYCPAAGFRAWQDGVELPVTLKHGEESGAPVDFYTHTALFKPGESTVTVSYLISPDYSDDWGTLSDWADSSLMPPPVYEGEWIGSASYDYTLHTGSYWAGDIGTAVVRWQLSDDFVGWGVPDATRIVSALDTTDPEFPPPPDQLLHSRIQSGYATPTPAVYQWVLHDIEPALSEDGFSPYDIGLHFFTPPTDWPDGAPGLFAEPDASASSELKLGKFSYPSWQLVDGDPSTAWAEGADGPGIGQWVDVNMQSARWVREIRILPGYAKRPDLFKKYNRPKRLRFNFSDGSSATVDLEDSPSLQRFPVSAAAESVRVTILAVYRGTTRDETYISEVDFGHSAAPAFEDPGSLLQAAREVPSADATPAALKRAVAATATPPKASNRAPRPGSPNDGLLLTATFALAVVVIWRVTP